MANNDPLGAGYVSCVRVGLMSWLAPVCLGCEPGPESRGSSSTNNRTVLHGGLARGTRTSNHQKHTMILTDS
jgi:hypothetical protein